MSACVHACVYVRKREEEGGGGDEEGFKCFSILYSTLQSCGERWQ